MEWKYDYGEINQKYSNNNVLKSEKNSRNQKMENRQEKPWLDGLGQDSELVSVFKSFGPDRSCDLVKENEFKG